MFKDYIFKLAVDLKLAYHSCVTWLPLPHICVGLRVFLWVVHPFCARHFTFHIPYPSLQDPWCFLFLVPLLMLFSLPGKHLPPKLTFFLAWFIPTHIFKVSIYYPLGCLSIVFYLYQLYFLYCCIIVSFTSLNSLRTAMTSSVCFHITEVPGAWGLSILNT